MVSVGVGYDAVYKHILIHRPEIHEFEAREVNGWWWGRRIVQLPRFQYMNVCVGAIGLILALNPPGH
jgi:hypothetical protein